MGRGKNGIAYQRPPTAFVVYFDTSALAEDFHLRRNELGNLGELASAFGILLKMSEVVVREHLNRYGETLGESIAKTNNQVASLQRLVHQDDEIAYVAASKATLLQEHEARLRRRLHALGIEVLPIPNVSHSDVVNRALARRKPFDDKGHNGYRDALIWEGLVEELHRIEASIKIVFVVANHKDFLDASRKKLHADLVEDLVDQGIDPERVIIANDIGQFNDEYLISPEEVPTQELPLDQDAQEPLVVTRFAISLMVINEFARQTVTSALDRGGIPVPDEGWDEADLLGSFQFECVRSVRLLGIQEFRRLSIKGSQRASVDNVWIKVEFEVRARFEVTYGPPMDAELLLREGIPTSWHRLMKTRDALIEVSMNYDPKTEGLISADIDNIQILARTA